MMYEVTVGAQGRIKVNQSKVAILDERARPFGRSNRDRLF
jgi:hypothetical protein